MPGDTSMLAPLGRLGPRSRAVPRHRLALGCLFGILAAVAAVAPVGGDLVVRGAVAVALVLLAAMQWTVDWRALVVALAIWLVLLGLLRRLVTEVVARGGADPLLLVAPAALGLLALGAIRRGALTRRTPLTTAVLALGGLTVLESANLTQAPLVASVAGLLFVLVPQLAFWIGRVLPDTSLHTVVRVIAVLMVAVAGYGLLQTFTGLPPWDRRWVAEFGYTALNVNGAVRAFGTSASAAEYAALLSVGIVCWLAPPRASRWLTLAAVGVLATAQVLASARGILVLLVAALVFVAAARLSVPGGAALVLTAAAMVLVSVVAAVLMPHTEGTSSASRLLEHQLSGLANPFNPDTSSLSGHFAIFQTGLTSAPEYPFGRGIGVISMGVKFGGTGAQTEADLSNVAVAFGPLGIVIFLSVLVLGLVRAYRVASRTPAPLALAALGILIATGNQWLNGGMYAVAWLPWLVLGWLDRPAPVPEAEGNG